MRSKWFILVTMTLAVTACSGQPSIQPKPSSGSTPVMQPGQNPTDEPNLNFKGDANAYQKGGWSQVVDWPLIAIHAALLPDGNVMTYGTGPDGTGEAFSYDVWNLKQGLTEDAHTTLPVTTSTDIFCSAQAIVPGTGQMFITGGTIDLDDPEFDGSSADINFFDLNDYSLSKSPRQLLAGRWYPTVTTLANGEVLVHGGRSAPYTPVMTPEVYNPKSGWRELSNAENDTAYYHWYYPWSFVAPDGRVFFTTESPRMWFLDAEGAGELEFVGNRPDGLLRGAGSAALYDEGKLLVAGGQQKDAAGMEVSTETSLLIDINNGKAKVTQAQPMNYKRSEHDLTILPDGTVLASGGSAVRNELVDVALEPELWDPNTGEWEVLKANTTPRLYHSTTLLLPDGTLLMAGGGRPGPITESGAQLTNTNAELFYPPYLFKKNGSGELAPRLQVLDVEEPRYAQNFDIQVGSEDVDRVTLVRAGSVTHALNMEQRFVELEFTQNGNTISATAPSKPELAPPGTYLLFVLDSEGVPSYGEMITLGL